MKHHYNLIANDSGPVIRDCPVYDASAIIKGQALTDGTTTRGAVLIDALATGVDFVGVSAEAKTCSTTALTTGTLVFAKVILNPDSVYLAQYDPGTTPDMDITSSTTTVVTVATMDDDLDGSWLYINSGKGVGQLAFIGAADATTLTLDTTTAFTTALDSTSDALLIRHPWAVANAGGNDLDATFSMMLSQVQSTGEILALENYIEAATIPFGPLRPRQHHMLTGLNTAGVKFYSDIYFMDSILRNTAAMA